MIIRYHRKFLKSYHKLPVKIQITTDEKIRLFSKDPFFSQLENHALTGKYQGYRSVNITGDYRAIYKEFADKEVVFVILGTHAELYG